MDFQDAFAPADGLDGLAGKSACRALRARGLEIAGVSGDRLAGVRILGRGGLNGSAWALGLAGSARTAIAPAASAATATVPASARATRPASATTTASSSTAASPATASALVLKVHVLSANGMARSGWSSSR